MLQSDALPALLVAMGVLTPVVTVVGAHFGVRYGLNGTKKDLREFKSQTAASLEDLKTDVKEIRRGQEVTAVSVGVCQAQIQRNQEWIRDVEHRLSRHVEEKKP